MEWSNGVIFLIATFWPEGLCNAELSMSAVNLTYTGGHQLPDDAVCALANNILDIVLIGDIEGDLSRASLGVLTLSHGSSLE